MEGMERMPRPTPERELESQAHRETLEEGEREEMKAALERTLSDNERALFDSAFEPGISDDERRNRVQAFNDSKAGTPDEEESITDRIHDSVPMNIGGITVLVSRSARGTFSIAFPGE